MAGSKRKQNADLQGHCPECRTERYAEVVCQHQAEWSDEEHAIWGRVDYRILKCRGCRSIYFQRDEVFSENTDHRRNPSTGEYEEYLKHDITYWPVPAKRDEPKWMIDIGFADSVLGNILKEIYAALNNDLRVLAAIGVRTAFDRASEKLGVDSTLNFAQKLAALYNEGHIGGKEQEKLAVLTDAGSAAAHRAWRPKPKELHTLVDILENFLDRCFVVNDAVDELKARVPKKPELIKAKPPKKGKAAQKQLPPPRKAGGGDAD